MVILLSMTAQADRNHLLLIYYERNGDDMYTVRLICEGIIEFFNTGIRQQIVI